MGTILLVERPSDERTRTRMALQMAGHEVVEASSAHHGAALLRQARPDVAVIDDDIPELHATETLLLLRGIPGYKTLPAVLLMPGIVLEDAEIEADSPTPVVPGVYGVRKPASCNEIEVAVERALTESGEDIRVHKLEQRREMWQDISLLNDLARENAPSRR
jgi:CheY-like chemotaxis protein